MLDDSNIYVTEQDFVAACSRYGLLLDANMLLVYVVGHHRPDDILRFQRTKDDYDVMDYKIIKGYVGKSKGKTIITTPYIITEVEHFVEAEQNRPKKGKTTLDKKYYRELLNVLGMIREHYMGNDAMQISKTFSIDSLMRFGISDLSLARATDDGYAFLSSDRDLCDRLLQAEDRHCIMPGHDATIYIENSSGSVENWVGK